MTDAELAKKLKLVEERLNNIVIEGCSVGSVLSKFHENIYMNNLQSLSLLRFILMLMLQWTKGLFILKPASQVIKNNILLSKITNKDHVNALIDPIKKHYKNKAVMYTPGIENELVPYHFSKKFTPRQIFRISKAVIQHFVEIKNIYESEGITSRNFQLTLTLIIQLNAFRNWHLLFKENRPTIIVVDFDRDNRNAPMLLSAKKYDIKTISLVHGTVEPNFGFAPIIASQIYCWGTFQKSQLKALGILESQIRITGSPIARKIIKLPKVKKERNNKTIGVGLNPMGDEYNYAFLSHLFENEFDIDVNWEIKLHPSMLKLKWMVEMENEKISIHESSKLSTEDFFNCIDILIVGNSGLGFEAVVNDIPIWIYSPDNEGYFHDKVMIMNGKCPDITSAKSLRYHLNCLKRDSTYINSLLEVEKSFVLGEFYFCIGEDSTKKIISTIEENL
jgi:hypothetical protein